MKSWFDDAVCKDFDTNLFYPEALRGIWTADSPEAKRAKDICNVCPVMTQCREYGLREIKSSDQGVYGGLTQGERRVLRRKVKSA